MILLATVWTITMKYVINCIDLRSEVPWENKSIWGLYVDLAAGEHEASYQRLEVNSPSRRFLQAGHLRNILLAHPYVLRPAAQYLARRLYHAALFRPQMSRPQSLSSRDSQYGHAVSKCDIGRDGSDGGQDLHHLSRGYGIPRRASASSRRRRCRRGTRDAGERGSGGGGTSTSCGCSTPSSSGRLRTERHAEEAALRARLPFPLPQELARASTELSDLVRARLVCSISVAEGSRTVAVPSCRQSSRGTRLPPTLPRLHLRVAKVHQQPQGTQRSGKRISTSLAILVEKLLASYCRTFRFRQRRNGQQQQQLLVLRRPKGIRHQPRHLGRRQQRQTQARAQPPRRRQARMTIRWRASRWRKCLCRKQAKLDCTRCRARRMRLHPTTPISPMVYTLNKATHVQETLL